MLCKKGAIGFIAFLFLNRISQSIAEWIDQEKVHKSTISCTWRPSCVTLLRIPPEIIHRKINFMNHLSNRQHVQSACRRKSPRSKRIFHRNMSLWDILFPVITISSHIAGWIALVKYGNGWLLQSCFVVASIKAGIAPGYLSKLLDRWRNDPGKGTSGDLGP